MVIKNFKKKVILSSVMLIIVGIIITFVGFAKIDFKKEIFIQQNGAKWYQTIRVDSDKWSYGFKLGENIYIMNLGEW